MAKIFGVHSAAQPKNFLINGAFDYWQRSTSKVISGQEYICDRWRNDSPVGSVTQSRLSNAGLPGTVHAMRLDYGSNSAMIIQQALEQFMTFMVRGKTVTFSVWLKRNSTYNAGANLRMRIMGSTDVNASFTNYSVLANLNILGSQIGVGAWTLFKVSAAIPDTSAANTVKVVLENQDTISSGGQLDIGQAMLFDATTPIKLQSNFFYCAENAPAELELCQRYYEKSYRQEVTPGTVSTGAGDIDGRTPTSGDSTDHFGPITYNVRKRVTATITYYNPNTGATGTGRIDGQGDRTALVQSNSETGFSYGLNNPGGGPFVYRLHWTADAEI